MNEQQAILVRFLLLTLRFLNREALGWCPQCPLCGEIMDKPSSQWFNVAAHKEVCWVVETAIPTLLEVVDQEFIDQHSVEGYGFDEGTKVWNRVWGFEDKDVAWYDVLGLRESCL